MTGDEFNELNKDLPWWVKKKIIDSRRQSHPPAPPPPPAPPRYPCSIAEPQSPRNVSKDFVGLLPPKVQPVGSWMKGNILFCQELVMWLNTWEEHPVPRFQFNCCSTLLWVEIHRMSWKSLESFPRFVRWVPQPDPREHALSLGWWTPKRGWGGLFPQLYRSRACRGFRSEWHPPRIYQDIFALQWTMNQTMSAGPWMITTGHLAKMWRWATPMSFTGSIPRPGPLMGLCRAALVVSSIDP